MVCETVLQLSLADVQNISLIVTEFVYTVNVGNTAQPIHREL